MEEVGYGLIGELWVVERDEQTGFEEGLDVGHAEERGGGWG